MYRPNEPAVAHETIDGELIIINTLNGYYYSTTGIGAYLWDALSSGWTPDELCSLFGSAGHSFGSNGVIADYVRILLEEGLLVKSETAAAKTELPDPPALAGIPVLHKYTDLQELIELDPIHEVDAGIGWPVQRKEG